MTEQLPWGGILVGVWAIRREPMRDGTPRCHPGWRARCETLGPDMNRDTFKPQKRLWEGPPGFATEEAALMWRPPMPLEPAPITR